MLNDSQRDVLGELPKPLARLSPEHHCSELAPFPISWYTSQWKNTFKSLPFVSRALPGPHICCSLPQHRPAGHALAGARPIKTRRKLIFLRLCLLVGRENGFPAETPPCDWEKPIYCGWDSGSWCLVAHSSVVGVLLPLFSPAGALRSVLSAVPSTAPCICVGGGQTGEWKAWKTFRTWQYNLQG